MGSIVGVSSRLRIWHTMIEEIKTLWQNTLSFVNEYFPALVAFAIAIWGSVIKKDKR